MVISSRFVAVFKPWIIFSTTTHLNQRDTYNPAPAAALNARSGGVEVLLEVVEGSESLGDGLLEGTLGEGTTVALTLGLGTSKVLPEEGVVDVSCGREGEQR